MAKHLRIQHRRYQRQHHLSCPNHQHHLERDGTIDGLRRFCWHHPIVVRHLDVHEPVQNERHVSMSMERFPMASASMCASIQCPHSPSTCICAKQKSNVFISKCLLHSVSFHSPVVVSPGELRTDQSFWLKRLHRLDDVQVWNIFELWMFWSIEILLCDHNTLLEEMLVDSYAMLLWHKHSANDMRREQIWLIQWNRWDNCDWRPLRRITNQMNPFSHIVAYEHFELRSMAIYARQTQETLRNPFAILLANILIHFFQANTVFVFFDISSTAL